MWKKEARVQHISICELFFLPVSEQFLEIHRTYNLIQSPGDLMKIPTVSFRSCALHLPKRIILARFKNNTGFESETC